MDLTVVWSTAHQPAAHTPVEAVRVVLLVLRRSTVRKYSVNVNFYYF